MKLLCCGDSLVNGFPFPRSDSFPSVIARETGIEVRNIGMNGITAMDTAHYLTAELRKAERSVSPESARSSRIDAPQSNNELPDALLISCGSNDFMLGMSDPGDVCSDVKSMCAEASSCGVKQIFVCSPPLTDPAKASRLWMPGVSYERVNEDLCAYAELLRIFVEEANSAELLRIFVEEANSVELLRIFVEEANSVEKANNNVSETAHESAAASSNGSTADIKFIDIQQAYLDFSEYHDGVHPTKDGYRFIAETICKELIPA